MESEDQAINGWDAEPDLWEHQGHRLTVRNLIGALTEAEERGHGDVPVMLAIWDGQGRPLLVPMEVGFTGSGRQPDAVVITSQSS